MTIKPFAIQGADLTLGGVNLQAGATAIVIPGVTQATNYKVDEVNDVDDVEQTQQFNPAKVVAVDAITYALIAAGTNPTTTADFTVELDDDNYIDEIKVNGQGTYTAQQASTNASTDMYAYRGTGSASNRPIVPNDWVQVPFRPKMRAGEVETIGGGTGGGVVQRSVNFPYGESGDTKGTLALTQYGQYFVCTADYVEPNSEPTEFDIVAGEAYNIYQDEGQNEMSVTIARGAYPEIDSIMETLGYQSEGWQVYSNNVTDGATWNCTANVSTGNRWSFIWTYHPGNDSNSFDQGEEFTLTYTPQTSFNKIWKQADTGDLNILGSWVVTTKYDGGEGNLELDYNNVDLWVENDDNSIAELWLHNNNTSEPHADINVAAANTNDPTATKTWSFKHDGSLEFPDGTLQTTAYTGQSGGGVTVTTDLWIAGGESPGGPSIVTSTDGITWTPQQVNIPNFWIKRVAISDTMIVYLAANGEGDAIYYADAPETTPTLATDTDAYQGGTLEWREINYLGGKFVAVGGARSTATIQSTIQAVSLVADTSRETTLIILDNVTFDFDYVNVTIANATNTELNGNFRLRYNSLDTLKLGIYELRNTDDSAVTLTSSDISGATLQSTNPENVSYPVHAYSTDGITWTYGEIDINYIVEELGPNAYCYFGDVAYNGSGYLLPVVNDRFGGYSSNPSAAGPGAFYTTDITAMLSVPQFIVGQGLGVILPGVFNNIASYADGTFFVCDDNFALWTASDPFSPWTLTQLAPAMTSLFGYESGTEPGQVDGDVDSAVGGTVNGSAMWAGTTNEGQVIWTTDNGTTIQGSVPDPYIVTATLVSSSSVDTLLDFAGEQEKPYQWEKVTLTVTGNDDVSWEGTYYVYAPDINSNSQFYLYDAPLGNGIPSDGFNLPSNPFTVELSRGRDLGAIHIADDVCIVYSNSSNTLHRSVDMINWTTVFTNTDYSIDDIYYGTRSTTASNRLDYTDEETGYNSSAVLTYDFKVDVDNAQLDVDGDGGWSLGSSAFDTKIFSRPQNPQDDPKNVVIRANDLDWEFTATGELEFPNGTVQTTAYVHQNINMDGGGAAAHYEQSVGFVDGGFSSTRHGVADPVFNGGDRLTESNEFNLNGGGA